MKFPNALDEPTAAARVVRRRRVRLTSASSCLDARIHPLLFKVSLLLVHFVTQCAGVRFSWHTPIEQIMDNYYCFADI